jgi:hypothetical protein
LAAAHQAADEVLGLGDQLVEVRRVAASTLAERPAAEGSATERAATGPIIAPAVAGATVITAFVGVAPRALNRLIGRFLVAVAA